MAKEYINLTHTDITMNSGEVYKKSGDVASAKIMYFENDRGNDEEDVQAVIESCSLPPQRKGIKYIVSLIVQMSRIDRKDLVSPATNHERTKRDEQGRIISVPFLINLQS